MKNPTHWKVRDSRERLDIFPCWREIILFQENLGESATQVILKSTISSYLELLHTKFVHCFFPARNMAQLEQNVWISNRFKAISLELFCLVQMKHN